MVRVTLPLQGVAIALFAASSALGQTPKLVVEPPKALPRLTPQPQTAEPPASKPQPAEPSASCPVVIEEEPLDLYPPILMPPPPPPATGHKHRWKHGHSSNAAPAATGPYNPWSYGSAEFANGYCPSPYPPPAPPANSGHKHRWRHTPPNDGVAGPVPYGVGGLFPYTDSGLSPYGDGEFAGGYYPTPVGPPPPPNGTGKKNRWKQGNPDLSYYPVPGADMMDDGLNAFTDPNCLKKKHHLLHGLLHKPHAGKTPPPPPVAPPQPCLEDEGYFPIDG